MDIENVLFGYCKRCFCHEKMRDSILLNVTDKSGRMFMLLVVDYLIMAFWFLYDNSVESGII